MTDKHKKNGVDRVVTCTMVLAYVTMFGPLFYFFGFSWILVILLIATLIVHIGIQ